MEDRNISKYCRLYPPNTQAQCLRIHYRNIEVLDFPYEFPHVKELSLNHNKIESFEGLRNFPILERLSFAYNKVQNLDSLFHNIRNPCLLKAITYEGNYIEEDPDVVYKLRNNFTNLQEINGRLITQKISDHSEVDNKESETKFRTDEKKNYKHYLQDEQNNDSRRFKTKKNNKLAQTNSYTRIYQDMNDFNDKSRCIPQIQSILNYSSNTGQNPSLNLTASSHMINEESKIIGNKDTKSIDLNQYDSVIKQINYNLGQKNAQVAEHPEESYTEKGQDLMTFEPSFDKWKPYGIQKQTIESSIDTPKINIRSFLDNVVRLFETKRKKSLLKKVFLAWCKSYYEESIRTKAIEIEVKKKHNFLIVRNYFRKWTQVMASNHSIFEDNYLSYKPRINLEKENRFKVYDDVEVQNNKSDSYYSEIRKPYVDKLNSHESKDSDDSEIFRDISPHEMNFTNAQIPEADFTDFRSIRVTNHKVHTTIEDSNPINSNRNEFEPTSDSRMHEYPLEIRIKRTLNQEIEDITKEERLCVLRKIFLKWCIICQNTKMERIKARFETLCSKKNPDYTTNEITLKQDYPQLCDTEVNGDYLRESRIEKAAISFSKKPIRKFKKRKNNSENINPNFGGIKKVSVKNKSLKRTQKLKSSKKIKSKTNSSVSKLRRTRAVSRKYSPHRLQKYSQLRKSLKSLKKR
ncbi:unnamed protein product [Moneuplotes crassus]|uniref:Uncharacterized protein n=1 Tax=Euplotes crassus TaxID=5936 RepID=A0AAD1U445_EUPCR|nr:unnamed protein product [Moneuplotes crassus]